MLSQPSQTSRIPSSMSSNLCLTVGLGKEEMALMKPYPKYGRCEAGSLRDAHFSKEWGLLRWHLIIFSHSRSSPGTWFLFLEEPLFVDCEEGNTQELLLAATCFGKH